MMKWIRQQLSRDEGFTLIELMVVVLIIAVLVAIAIPSFLGFRASAQDRSAQSDLRNVLLAEKALYVDTGAYSSTAADLQYYEASVDLTAVTVDTTTAGQVCMGMTSDSGTEFSILEHSTSGTTYYHGDAGCDDTGTGGSGSDWQAAKAAAG